MSVGQTSKQRFDAYMVRAASESGTAFNTEVIRDADLSYLERVYIIAKSLAIAIKDK